MRSTTEKPAQKWATMSAGDRTIFVAKVCVMVCTAGYVFGGVLVEGMVYPDLPNGPELPK